MWKEEGLYSAKEFANWGNVASGENLKYTPLRQREAAFYRESSAQVPDWSNDMQMRESNHPVLIGINHTILIGWNHVIGLVITE